MENPCTHCKDRNTVICPTGHECPDWKKYMSEEKSAVKITQRGKAYKMNLKPSEG